MALHNSPSRFACGVQGNLAKIMKINVESSNVRIHLLILEKSSFTNTFSKICKTLCIHDLDYGRRDG